MNTIPPGTLCIIVSATIFPQLRGATCTVVRIEPHPDHPSADHVVEVPRFPSFAEDGLWYSPRYALRPLAGPPDVLGLDNEQDITEPIKEAA